MSELTEPQYQAAEHDTDLVAAIGDVLRQSATPLTLPRIRLALPAGARHLSLAGLAELMQRQAAAGVFVPFAKYRSPHERYWDRPLAVHVEALLRNLLKEDALPWSEIRRRLPPYAKSLAEPVLRDLVAHGQLFQHPPLARRQGVRFGLKAAEPDAYLAAELDGLYRRMGQLGFSRDQARAGLLRVLNEEEWS